MKRSLVCIAILCVSLASFAGVKIETFDDNKWNWTESSDKYKSVSIIDGNMILETKKKQKGVPDILAMAHSFVRIPARALDNYRLTIHAVMPKGMASWWTLFFNTSKECLTIDEEYTESFSSYALTFVGNYYVLGIGDEMKQVDKTLASAGELLILKILGIGDGMKHAEKLPFKMKNKEFPIEIVITKDYRKTTFEINGVQIFKGECEITEPCMGFMVPVGHKLIISDVSVEQEEEE